MTYNPRSHYWIIAGSTTQVFSSASGSYVPLNDPTYMAWLALGWSPSRLSSETELIGSLAVTAPDIVVLTKTGLIAYAANARYNKEIAGITVSGISVATDRESQAMLTGAFNMVAMNPAFATQWKGSSGAFVLLNAATITALAAAVGAHVAACFAAEATIDAAINAGTMTTPAQIDAAMAAETP